MTTRETAVICAIARDEGNYIDEWITYHLKLGFDAIYVYDNSDANDLAELPGKWPGKVHVIHFPGNQRQMAAYDTFIQEHRSNHTWAAFIDVDEFIVLRRHPTIKHLLRERCGCGALALNWYLFGSSGEADYSPDPVLKRFQHRGQHLNPHVKCIVRLQDAYTMFNPHVPILRRPMVTRDTQGRPVNGPFNPAGTDDVAVVHHYFVKSRGEFERKRARGRADNPELRDPGDFEAHDLNDVHDASAWEFATS